MPRRLHILLALAVLSAFSARNNGFGGPPDAGRDMTDADHRDTDRDGGGRAAVGEPCAAPDDCVEDALCIGSTTGEFICMQRCAQPYDLCVGEAICLPVMTDEAAICYIGGVEGSTMPCANNLDCAPGLLCFGASNEYYCRRACDDTAEQCASGEACERLDSGAGLCRAVVGTACTSSADCDSELQCSDDIGSVSGLFPGGYCSKSCQQDADCPATAVCGTVPGTTSGVCLQACQHISDCRFNANYACADASICNLSTDPDACQQMFGAESLCVPGPF